MAESCDVAVIGGGAIGSAVAFFLLEKGFPGRVAIIERDPSYRFASSALSASSIRQQFSTRVNIALSRFGIDFLRQAEDRLQVDGDRPSLGLKEAGYLFLASPEGRSILDINHLVQRAAGADVAVLRPEELQKHFPWLNTEGLAAGSLGLTGEGWFDGPGLMQAFRRKAQSLGARYLAQEVTGIERDGVRVAALRTGDGSKLVCGTVVNAAGPQAGTIAEMAGLTLPVEPRKRCVFVFDCKEELKDCPLVIDTSGVWFRPEGPRFIAGISPPPDRDPANPDFEVDHALFDEIVWPALAARVPAFEAIKVTSSWAGHYEYNTFDQNGVVGPHPEVANFLFANGFSGHGIQQSPAVGCALAEWIMERKYRSVDPSDLGYERIPEGRPLRELNIV